MRHQELCQELGSRTGNDTPPGLSSFLQPPPSPPQSGPGPSLAQPALTGSALGLCTSPSPGEAREAGFRALLGAPTCPAHHAPPHSHLPRQPCGDRQCSLKTHFAVQRTEAQWLCLSSTSKREPLKGLEPENGVFRSRLQRLHQERAEAPGSGEKWQSLGARAGGGPARAGRVPGLLRPGKLGSPAARGAASAPGPRAVDSLAWEAETPHGHVPETTSRQGSRSRNTQTGCGRRWRLRGQRVGVGTWPGGTGGGTAGLSWRGQRGRRPGLATSCAPYRPGAGESLKDPFHR